MQSDCLKLNCITLVWLYLCNDTDAQSSRIYVIAQTLNPAVSSAFWRSSSSTSETVSPNLSRSGDSHCFVFYLQRRKCCSASDVRDPVASLPRLPPFHSHVALLAPRLSPRIFNFPKFLARYTIYAVAYYQQCLCSCSCD